MTHPLSQKKNEGWTSFGAVIVILLLLMFAGFLLYLFGIGVLFALNTLFSTAYPFDAAHAWSVVILFALLCGVFACRRSAG